MSGMEEQFIRDVAYVAAGVTDQVITNNKGTILQRIIIVPATTSPGVVTYQEGAAGADRTVFVGGAVSLTELKPIVVELGIRALAEGFRVSTGANVSAIVVGRFNATVSN